MTTDFLFETLEASPDFGKVSALLKGGNRAVYLYGNKVGDDSLYNTFSFHMFICLYNLLL